MGFKDDTDWRRVGVDAGAAGAGLALGGPLGAGIGIAVAEGVQWYVDSDEPRGSDDATDAPGG